MRLWPSLTAWLRQAVRTAPRVGATRALLPDAVWSLRFRLLLTVTIGLMPIAAVSVLQGLERARVDVANVHEKLAQSAEAAASSEENVLASAEQILRAVGNLSDVRDVSAQCDRALGDALIGVRFFNNLARMDAQGRVVCSALPIAKGQDASELAVFRAMRKTQSFSVSEVIRSSVGNNSIITAMLPIENDQGKFDGAVAIALDVRWLDFLLRERRLPKGSVVAVFDQLGTLIASNNDPVARALFGHPSSGGRSSDDVQSGTDGQGISWTYAAAPLVGKSVFVGFAMAEGRLFGPTYLHVGTDFLMPIIMIGLAWAAIWIATERQVTQWIVYLRRVSAAYRTGHYGVRPALDDAPNEFRQLGAALSDMASAIQDRDQKLRDAVVQKTILIKEIHHRVKNNLQIVMSLLSLQAAQVRDLPAREALTQAQVRINALALVHRILHEIEDQTTIDLTRLLQELTQQLVEGMGGEGAPIKVETDLVERTVAGELAVPIALFTVEALTNIFKHAFPRAHPSGAIFVRLHPVEGGKLRLAVEDNGVGFATDDSTRSVGSRLIKTFGQQIGGVSLVRSEPGKGTIVELIFTDPDVAGGTAEDQDAGAPLAAKR